jgi:hypothetical protein
MRNTQILYLLYAHSANETGTYVAGASTLCVQTAKRAGTASEWQVLLNATFEPDRAK